jgi:hypothetical protein
VGRLVVAAVVVLAAIAAADGARRANSGERSAERAAETGATAPELVAGEALGHVPVGSFTRTSVVRQGREVLGSDEVAAGFPVLRDGLIDIAHVAVAPDGTLVLAVYRFPWGGGMRPALQLWRDGRLVAAFTVPSGSFAGGLGFSADGALVATYSSDRRSATLFDRRGRRAASLLVG